MKEIIKYYLLLFSRFKIIKILFNNIFYNFFFFRLIIFQLIFLIIFFKNFNKIFNFIKIFKKKKLLNMYKNFNFNINSNMNLLKKNYGYLFYSLHKDLYEKKFLTKSKNIINLLYANFIPERAYNIKILLKKHNLFLVLLNNKAKTLLKLNLGASGFNKKKKFTGYAIEKTTLNFFKKARRILENKAKTF